MSAVPEVPQVPDVPTSEGDRPPPTAADLDAIFPVDQIGKEAPVIGNVLDDTREFIRRFCVFSDEHALTAVTLWAAHTHMVEHFHTTPRLALLSPEAGSGKTRVLEVLALLVPEPMFSLSASPAAVFRTLAQMQITLLFDEIDTVFKARGKDDQHEDLRALLNAGYKRGATIPRCVGPKHEVQHFEVYAAVALAGLGDMPDTIMTRSVIIRMRRRAPHEPVEPFRTREHEFPGHLLRDRLAAWAARVGELAGLDWPKLPEGIVDRPAEIWEPLIAVADRAGGHWPETARAACVALCSAALDRRASLGVRLLGDLRIVFGNADALHTEMILERLHAGDTAGLGADAPWADLHGKPLNGRQLASMLRPYGINSTKVKTGGRSLQGYRREHLHDAWQRYLSSVPAQPEPPEPMELAPEFQTFGVPQVPQVPLVPTSERDTAAPNGQIVCANCRHFTARPGQEPDGYCNKLNDEVWSRVPFDCSDYQP